MKKKLFILAIFILLISGSFIQTSFAEDNELETSLVLLKIQSENEVIKEDPFFELLDMDDHVLLPLNMLTSHLELDTSYNREQNIVTIENEKLEKKVQVDLNKKEYIDHFQWNNHSPVVSNGEFFLSIELFEYLTESSIEWNSQYQELIITGEYFKKEKRKVDNKQKTEKKKKEIISKEVDVTGPTFSFGSIQYMFKIDGRKERDSTDLDSLNGEEYVYMHGRAGEWAISLGQKSEFDLLKEEEEISIPLIRAKYDKNNKLIILGDANISFPRTLGDNKIRGLYFRLGDKQVNDLVAYTSVTGKAKVGDTVTLFVNGRLYDKKRNIEKEQYHFKHVILSLDKLNTIRLIIKNQEGKEQKILKKIMASPRILEKGKTNITSMSGYYQEDDSENVNGKAVGVKYDQAVTDDLSVNLESAIREDKNSSDKILGSNFGIAWRLNNRAIITFDWLIGGVKDDLKQGLNTSLIYGFDPGHIKFIYFYVPAEVKKGVIIESGEGKKLKSSWDINKKVSLQTEFSDLQKFDEYNSNIKKGNISIGYNNIKNLPISLKGNIGRTEKTLTKNEMKIKEIIDEIGLLTDSKIALKDYYQDIKLNIITGKIERNNLDKDISLKELNIESGLSKIITNDVIGSCDITADGIWYDDKLFEASLETTSNIKWNYSPNTMFSFQGELNGSNRGDSSNEIILEEKELTFNANTFLNKKVEFFLSCSRNESIFGKKYVYYTGNFGIDYFINKGLVSLVTGYVSPLGDREKPQWIGEFSFEKELKSGLGLEFKTGVIYDNLWEKEPEYYITASANQILGFAGKVVQGQQFNDGEHISYIGGLVYLDLNGNKKFDKNDERLKDIKMFLNGRRVSTNEKGVFRFDYVRPNTYELGFALNSLPADYNIVTDSKLVKIRENENLFLEYGLTMNGTISGKVFKDQNANGKYDNGEKPIDWVGISLDNGKKKVFTDSDGEFYFEGVPLGEHKLKILDETLPSMTEISGVKEFSVTISKENLDQEEILIPVVYKFVD